ncbi:hypothetical protein CHLNCDRAFT_145151 [Chlorella variabilis]|uniref:Uncharacterized protein n=1 Tax=Chlorella variabilis TaxID=554065 RepID=E1ZCQ0_CHLVA|nr:hypothetical protein CHLNCDRAFT_145151 [Chlorella variabilis]EFN56475.1 hypothetical protein CHLNCDRAFT_145151 [Chlorella variabilis]|eukprot:XP_005848577.1 hypothetical protein CHLNCDRAFT_145151 [Chlorella variabilis]
MQQHVPPPELVPVQLTLGSSKGTFRDWVLWPVAVTTQEELESFAAGLVSDLGVPPQFRRPVADAIGAQVADWVANVPPPATGPSPRRELVRLDLVLGGSLRLRDQFWWDLHAATPTPEDFAAELCANSDIDACHGAAVAAAIRIELGKLRRSAPINLQLPMPRILDTLATGAAGAAGAEPGDADALFGLKNVYADRQEWHKWGPSQHQLSVEEAQALQKQQQLVVQQRQQQQLAQRLHQQAELERAELMAKQSAAAAQQQSVQGPAAQQAKRLQQLHEQRPPAPGDGEVLGARRQLRQRRGRASRLKELLRQEEEADEESNQSSASLSGGGGGGGRSTARAAEAAGGSTASRDYLPDEDSLMQQEMQEAEEERKEARHRPSRPRQRRRTAGAAGKAAAVAQKQQQQLLPTPQQQAMLPMQLPSSGSAGAPPLLGHGMGGGGGAGMPPLLPSGSGVGGALFGNGMGGALMSMGGGSGVVPVLQQQQQLPPGMVPTGSGPIGGGMPQQPSLVPQQSLPPQGPLQAARQVPPAAQVHMVGGAIVHFARELNMKEDKIRAMLSRTPQEQLSLFRTLHQLVQQARARQQQQLETAAMLAAQVQQGVGAGLPPMQAPALPPEMLPPMPMPLPAPREQQHQPVNQFSEMFSEMFPL